MIRLPDFSTFSCGGIAARRRVSTLLKSAGLVMGAANALNAVANVKTMSDITNKKREKELSGQSGKRRAARRNGPDVDIDESLIDSLSDEQLENLMAILSKHKNRGRFAKSAPSGVK